MYSNGTMRNVASVLDLIAAEPASLRDAVKRQKICTPKPPLRYSTPRRSLDENEIADSERSFRLLQKIGNRSI